MKNCFWKRKTTQYARDVPRAPTATPILSWKLLNECLLISSSLTVISVAKSIRSHRWPSGSWKREKRTVSWIRGQIPSPRLGDMVDSATLCSLAGRYDNPMPESIISPSQGLRIWLVDLLQLNRHLCGKVDQVTQVTQRVLEKRRSDVVFYKILFLGIDSSRGNDSSQESIPPAWKFSK